MSTMSCIPVVGCFTSFVMQAEVIDNFHVETVAWFSTYSMFMTRTIWRPQTSINPVSSSEA